MKTIIEGTFPLRVINQSAMTERAGKEHPGNMHLWWNRSPIESSKKILESTLTAEQGESLAGGLVTAVDPFSGFGGLALAAVANDLPVVAGDLNSIATVLTKAATEIPSRFADSQAVSPDADNRIYTGVEGLAEDVLRYGMTIGRRLADRLGTMYPDSIKQDPGSDRVYSWIWTRTAPCPNPACGCRMPLSSSFVLSKLKNREYYVMPDIAGKEIRFLVVNGQSETAERGNKIGNNGAKFKCPACGEITTDGYVKEMGQKGNLGIQMMAVGYEGPSGSKRTSSPP